MGITLRECSWRVNGVRNMVKLICDNPNPEPEWVKAAVARALCQLSANLKVTRGSGDPSAIPEHAALFLKALHEYQTRLGHGLPPGEVARALDVTHEGGGGDAIGVALTRAENNIIGRALAVAAARQVNGSKTIAETRGEEQIQRGIDMQLRIIEGRRKEVATRAVKPRKGRRKKRVFG